MSAWDTFKFHEWEVRYVPSKPSILVVEVTTRCNLSCVHCFRRSMREAEGDMDYELFLRLMREVRDWGGVERITLTGWGEPTVHPNILDMLDQAKKVAKEVYLSTNGVTLAELADDLIRMKIDGLYVSVDSPEVETFSKLRLGGSLTKVLEGLKRLKELKFAKHSPKPAVTIIFTITKMNYRQVIGVSLLAKEVMANRLVYSNLIPPNKEVENLTCLGNAKCTEEVLRDIAEVSKEAMDGKLSVQSTYLNVRSYFLCPFIGYGATYICSDGVVAPCMYFAHDWTPTLFGVSRHIRRIAMGDLHRQSLLNIWRSPDYVRFRFAVRSGQMPSCLDCELAEYCSYTLENIYDCLGNTPSCGSCPFAKNLSFCPV